MIVNLHWQQESGFWLLTDHTYTLLRASGIPPVEALKTMCICAAMAFVHRRRPQSLEVEPE
jgi:hypothetical protein